MTKQELKQRTHDFAIRIYNVAMSLPGHPGGQIIAKQIIRSGTSVASNYSSVLRAKSDRDFVNKLSIVLEEADETLFWLEFIRDIKLIKPKLLFNITSEANELVAIFSTSVKTSRSKPKKILNRKTKSKN